MIQKFESFVNENNIDIDLIFKQLSLYIVNRINKETKDIENGMEIQTNDIEYYDAGDILECSFSSQKLCSNAEGESMTDHLTILKDGLKAFEIFRKIILNIEHEFDLTINTRIDPSKFHFHYVDITLFLSKGELKNRTKLHSFLISDKNIEKFNL